MEYLESQRSWEHRKSEEERKVAAFYRKQQTDGALERSKKYSLAEKVILKPSWDLLSKSLGQVLASRKTTSSKALRPLNFAELSTFLMASSGLQRSLPGADPSREWQRTVPSAGGLYGAEVYFFCLNVDGLREGLYHFQPEEGVLERLPWKIQDDDRDLVFSSANAREAQKTASGLIMITGVFQRHRRKYGHRYLRFCMLEVGCLCQNMDLAANAMGAGLWHQGAIDEGRSRRLLHVDGQQESVLHSALLLGAG
ncbi:MAG: SagB/ThcOx family dehydrogenase [Bdellovibrionaceae bacterium]|nr:SagB/ThcOx family dehydrogenase [Pseudobdellovibrionaceae bacterium]